MISRLGALVEQRSEGKGQKAERAERAEKREVV
jgi:hypothetical protein